jgi:hypothetical protein
MPSGERLTCNPRQYHAAHPHRCFVCRRTFPSGIRHTHEGTGAKTCSPLCVMLYERWWLRKRSEVQAVASTPNDAEARWVNSLHLQPRPAANATLNIEEKEGKRPIEGQGDRGQEDALSTEAAGNVTLRASRHLNQPWLRYR